MKLFSQRKGFKPIKSVMQVDNVDSELRNGLWNALITCYWKRIKTHWISHYPEINILFEKLWNSYFKRPIDTINDYWPDTFRKIRDYFFNCKWYEVYDFIEFIANNYPDEDGLVNRNFMIICNIVLKRELSAYRFVGGRITQITSEEEVSEIEKALEITKPLRAVNIHLRSALDLLADRKSPDYRNSVKESISAVEAICNLITKKKKATLGQALKKIENKVSLQSFEDAKFMLVSCSAFVNYLISKASKAGIKI